MDPSPHRGSPSHPLPTTSDSNNDQNQHRVRFAEGEPQTSYRIRQPIPQRGGTPGSGPDVYWDDRDTGREIDRESDANLVGYTFYREGTPTPPDYYEVPEKGLGHGRGPAAPVAESSTVGGGTAASDRNFDLGPVDQNETSNWSLADSNQMSPEVKKKMLWALIATVILIIIGIAVGVGVGLGVGLSEGNSTAVGATEAPQSTLPPPASESSPFPTKPPTTNPGGTNGAAEATGAAPPRPTYNSDCPALNNTIYHVPGSTKSFRRYCGIDYSGQNATDLAHAWTGSMADCMHTCASFNECTACSWGYLPGDDAGKHRCYMKKDLKRSHMAASDWCFAILQT